MATEDDQQPNKDDAFSLAGMGWKASARGPGTMIALLICICFAGLVFMGYLHHQNQQSAIQDGLSQHQKIEDKFNEMIYVLSLPQADREKLNLSMPASLREKVHRKRRDPADDQ